MIDQRMTGAAAALIMLMCSPIPALGRGRPPEPPPEPKVSFFAVAHEDDWQLFMMPEAYDALDGSQEKAVFIHITAGDAGAGDGGPAPVPYFAAREEGALRAVRFLVNAAREPRAGLGDETPLERVEVNGHAMFRYAYANTAAYFLRLPDGSGEGKGYESTGWQSLENLRVGDNKEIHSVDGEATYKGWDDLVATLRAVMTLEREGGAQTVLRIHETDASLNPGDHFDHRNAAFAMTEAADGADFCVHTVLHDSYDTRNRPVNLSGTELMIATGVWGATTSGLGDSYARSTWEPGHNAWVGRSYSRPGPDRGACGGGADTKDENS